MTLYTNDTLAKELALKAFPDYRGRKFKISPFDGEFTFSNNYWSGGTKSDYVILELATRKRANVPGINPLRESEFATLVPEGFCIVEHSRFCGKDMGITIHVRPENLARLLPGSDEELTDNEKIVLVATRAYKNSYAGETNCRFKEAKRETGISEAEFESAKEKLFEKGLLKKHGKSYMITNNGRNMVDSTRSLYSLRKEGHDPLA